MVRSTLFGVTPENCLRWLKASPKTRRIPCDKELTVLFGMEKDLNALYNENRDIYDVEIYIPRW